MVSFLNMIKPVNDFLLVERIQSTGKFQTIANKNKGRIIAVPTSMEEFKTGQTISFIATIEIGDDIYVKADDVLSIEE